MSPKLSLFFVVDVVVVSSLLEVIMFRILASLALVLVVSPFVSLAEAGVSAKVIRETVELLLKKGGREAAEMGMDGISRELRELAAKYGDDAIRASEIAGPDLFRIMREAGDNGPEVIKLLARKGDSAVWVVARKDRMAIFIKYGDEAADAMNRHKGVAEPLINTYGKSAVSALNKVGNPRNSKRLAMMMQDGEIQRIGRTGELLNVIRQYGDAAVDYIYKNRQPLAVSAVLTSFLANPGAYIESGTDLTIGQK